MGWLFGRNNPRRRGPPTPRRGSVSRAPTNTTPTKWARLKQRMLMMNPARLRKWVAEMTPAQRKAWAKRMKLIGAGALAATIMGSVYLATRRGTSFQPAHPTLIERRIPSGGIELESPLQGENVRVEVKPLPGETKKQFEQGLEEWRDVLEPHERGPPRRIGRFLVIPGKYELEALFKNGDFDEVAEDMGRGKNDPLKYDFRPENINVVQYDENARSLDREVPRGSLLIIQHVDSKGNKFSTYALVDDGNFIRYAYPPGIHGSTENANHTGYTGSLSKFLTENSWVSGYIPPNP